jgi:NitT/TauT family transport system substrate-binding protein
VIGLCVALAGCGAPVRPLRVGINAWPGYEFLYLAQEMGFYQDEGLAVRLVEFSSLPDARAAYERGNLDALGTTVVEVMQARALPRRELTMVAVIDESVGADLVLARPAWRDGGLRGARVGVELGSVGSYVLHRALGAQGLGFADVQVRSANQASIGDDLREDALDAAVTYPPMSTALLATGEYVPLFDTSAIPGEVVDVLAVDGALASAAPRRVEALLRAFWRARAEAEASPAAACALMGAREGVTGEAFCASLSDGIRLIAPELQADFLGSPARLAPVVDATDRVLRELGQVAGADRRAGAFTGAFVGQAGGR